MPHAARRTIAWVLLIVLAGIGRPPPSAAANSFPPVNPHAYFQTTETCPRCHVVPPGGPGTPRFSGEADALCLGCHRQENLGRTHPLNVRPGDGHRKIRIPEEFHRNEEGRMMCLTCHTAHGPYLSGMKAYPSQKPEAVSPAGEAYYKTFFLRRSSPDRGFAALCDACHEKP